MQAIRTIEQKRSGFALECVDSVKDKGFAGDYKGLVKKFPMMILKNGLLQTIAFLEAKGKDQHKALLDHVKGYLKNYSPLKIESSVDRFSGFLSNIDVNRYREITTDILAFAEWLGRYAEALIDKKEGESG